MPIYYYDVEGLGPYDGVDELTGSLHVNAAGIVTGTAKMEGGGAYSGPFHAVKIENGILTDLTPNASHARGGKGNDATPIQVAGRLDADGAAVFDDSGTIDVGAMLSASSSEATDISDGGLVTGTADGQAFTVHLGSSQVDAQLVSQADWCYGYGINNVGDVVGRGWFDQLDDFWVTAFIWHHTAGFSTLWKPGFFGFEAYDVNDHGMVVGKAKTVNDFFFPFRMNGGMEQLGGGVKGSANDVNDTGDIAGHLTIANQRHAYLHINSQAADVDLNTRIPPGSGWHLETAQAISDGNFIVGYGTHNGVDRPFLLKPLDQTPPWAKAGQGLTLSQLVITILFGVIEGGSGFGITPGGGPVPIDPDPFRLLRPGQRDVLIGMALEHLAREFSDPELRRRAQEMAVDTMKEAVEQMEKELDQRQP